VRVRFPPQAPDCQEVKDSSLPPFLFLTSRPDNRKDQGGWPAGIPPVANFCVDPPSANSEYLSFAS